MLRILPFLLLLSASAAVAQEFEVTEEEVDFNNANIVVTGTRVRSDFDGYSASVPIAILTLAAAAQAPQAAPAPQRAKPQKICRENERRTGSHIRSGRTCKTQEQWDRDDAARDRRPLGMQIKSEEPKRAQ